LNGATAKLPTRRPQCIPMDEFERKAYRELCIQAVFSIWNQEKRPAHLGEIYHFVQERVKEKIAAREWPFSPYRGKRCVEVRGWRVNEAASPLYYEDGVPKIVAVTSGIYQPNPVLFEVAERVEKGSQKKKSFSISRKKFPQPSKVYGDVHRRFSYCFSSPPPKLVLC